MTNQQLQTLVQQISLTFFSREFAHQASFNYRLRTTGGRYVLHTHNIEINPKMLSEHDRATLEGVIKHELCHYHLHLSHAGYHHRDQDFKQLLHSVGGSRYAPQSTVEKSSQHRYLYQCTKCGQDYPRARRVNVERFVCSRCHGRLRLLFEGYK